MSRTTRSRGRIETNLANIPLPAEVLALVADELEGDFKSLRALSRVSTAWSQRARDLLYRKVYLGDPKAKTRCKALSKILNDRPSLAHATRILTIVDSRKTGRAQCWFESCLDVERIIPLFNSVQRITVRGQGLAFAWDKMPMRARTALLDLFQGAHVKEIELVHVRGIRIVPFARYQHLTHLSLDHVTGDMMEQINVSIGQWTPQLGVLDGTNQSHETSNQLRALHIGGSGEALSTLFRALDVLKKDDASSNIPVLDLQHLKELRVDSRGLDQDALNAWSTILETCVTEVERYHIRHDHTHWLFSEDDEDVAMGNALLQLHRFPKLSCLHLTLVCEDLIDWGHGGWIEPLQAATIRALKSLSEKPSPAVLTELILTIVREDPDSDFGDFSVSEDLQDILEFEDFFHQLADALSNQTGFPDLKRVAIVFELHGSPSPIQDWPVLKRDFGEKLKELGPAGRDVLDVEYVWKP